MFGLKIFVRVQTFRQVPPVLPRNFCHPAIKPNMIIRCTNIRSPLYGTIGRVVACKGNGELEVKSQIGVVDGALENMELVAPPICMEIFTNN